MTPENQTPNTDTVTAIAVIVVTNTAADIWSAIAAGELSRDMILADWNRAYERRNRMIDAAGEMLDAETVTFAEFNAMCDDDDAELEAARKRRDMALAALDDFMGEVA